MSLENLLEDEAAGMAFPLDGKYFDHFPVIRREMCSDVAGPRPELAESLVELCQANYGEKYLSIPPLLQFGGGITSA